jgi:signal transduction histidine kinase/putative methionine-R-sulfoxide reductase with GAF domain
VSAPDLKAQLERETRVSAALREVGVALGTTLDLDQLLEIILQKITEALEADRATLYLLDEANDELVSRIVLGGEVKSIRLKLGHGIAGHVARTGRLLHVPDAYKDTRFNPEWDSLSGYRTHSILAAPMKNHLGKTIGVVQVLNKRQGEFSEVDADILSALSTQAAVSIDNSRLFLSVTQKNMQLLDTKEQLEHRVRDLKLLFDLESAMARAGSLEELFEAVLVEAMRACEARQAAVALRDAPPAVGASNSPLGLYVIDDKQKKLKPFALKYAKGLIDHAMRYNEPAVTSDADQETREEAQLDPHVGFEAQTAIAVPLEGDKLHTMGAVALYNKRDVRGFSDEDRELLQLIAANASTAIRLQLEREAREREERLTTIGRLLSGVIHDLKTPLTVISGYVQLMQQAEKPAQRDHFAELILKQFDHIGAMQREVLEFARGEKSILVRKVYLQRFFGDVKAELESELAKHDVQLVVDVQERGTARFDEGKILRIIHNLARNAGEAMADTGGTFTIKVTREKAAHRPDKSTRSVKDLAAENGQETLVLTFSDTGPGIPKDIEHRLFESFVTSGKKGGTGLGLAIVKKIAEEHGGTISAKSSSKGATFTLRLPQ